MLPEIARSSIKGRDAKKKIYSVIARETKWIASPMQSAAMLGSAYRNSEVHRFERGRITAPATVIVFLERERFFNS
jgi:hypothetical protein